MSNADDIFDLLKSTIETETWASISETNGFLEKVDEKVTAYLSSLYSHVTIKDNVLKLWVSSDSDLESFTLINLEEKILEDHDNDSIDKTVARLRDLIAKIQGMRTT